MWPAIEDFLWGAQVTRATDSPELREVKKYLRTWPFTIPRSSDLVICDPNTHGCLYMGGILAYMDEPFMHGMDAVVTILDLERSPKSEFRLPPRVAHMYIDANDDLRTDLTRYFEPTFRFIDSHLSEGQSVYVHCRAGISRSSTVVLYYIMRKYQLSLLQALQYLKSRRPVVQPNDAFLKQLANARQEKY